jgi:antitoxin FitA
MVALQIRDVPDDIRQTLAEQAAARGQSLQAFLLTLVTDQARRSTNLAVLERFGARQDGSQLSTAQVTAALDQARAEREALLSNADSDAR